MTPKPAHPKQPPLALRCQLATLFAMAFVLSATAPAPVEAARWNWSGSVAHDYTRLIGETRGEALGNEGTVIQWSLKSVVDVSDQVTINTRLCTSCHGLMIDQAFAEIRFKPQANLEVGRINVPFGDFHIRHDPANDAFLSKPLPYAMGHMLRYQANRFNLGVIPMPYVDHGVTFFGDVWIREALQIWYALYGVNGFRSDAPGDFTFKNQVADAGFNDNNENLSLGGRLSLAQGPVALGGSYLRGAYDPAAAYDYQAWGIDGSLDVRGVRLRTEYLERETDVLDGSMRAAIRKKGFFAQLEAPVHRHLTLVGRFDGLLREGPALATDNDESSAIVRWTIGANVLPTVDYSVRLQFENWRFTDFDDVKVLHAGVVVAY